MKEHAPTPLGSLVDANEAAKLLSVKPSLVYAMVKRGRLPHYRISNGVIRFAPSELSAWLKMQKGA